MGLPLAVSPSVRTPGVSLVVNMKAGASSPGTAPKRALLIATKSTAGTITPDTQLVEAVAGESDVQTYLGVGTPGHLASKRLFEEYGLALVDLVAPVEPAGSAATGTFTFTGGPPTVAWTVTLWIAGRKIEFAWLVGETDTQAATKAAAAINALGRELPVTAGSAAGVATATFRIKGLIGNDCRIRATQTGGAGGTVTASGTNLAGGTLEPDLANVISLIAGKEYDIIVPCLSNTDVATASATSGPGKLKTDLNLRSSGFTAKLQQAVFGHSAALSAVKTGTAQHNFEYFEYAYCLQGESLPCEFAAAEAGARLRDEAIDPAVNRINKAYKARLFGAADLSQDEPTDTEIEDALQNGVTILTYTAAKELRPSRPITTYFKDASGNADDRVLDTSRVTGTFFVAKDLRVQLPREFEGAKLSRDLLPGEDEPPEGVTQEKDVKAFIDARVRFSISRGIVRKDLYEQALALGTFICKVDPSDPSQLDIVLPLTIVPPLAKFSLVVHHRTT